MGNAALQEKADTIALNIAERLWKSFAESHASKCSPQQTASLTTPEKTVASGS